MMSFDLYKAAVIVLQPDNLMFLSRICLSSPLTDGIQQWMWKKMIELNSSRK